ncbi:AAA family ATPase [Asaia siamensis]|uniref:AAA family ATPase n=1 Tax=Asaia siamensis TaxID=110479 RepID=UPI001664AF8A|nr:AAA family ATPase [Asaia siamensis]
MASAEKTTAEHREIKWLTIDIHEFSAPRWLVKDLIPEQALVCLFGAPNTGKTFIALDIALSVAFGRPALSQDGNSEGNPTSRPVVFVLREALHNIHRRIAAWCDHKKIPRKQAQEHLAHHLLIPDTSDELDIRIDRSTSRRKLIDAIKQRCPNPALIVLDPLVDMMDGDENSARDMSRFVNGLNELRTQLGACVLVIHHQGKYWRPIERGSSVLQAAVDTHIHLLDATKTTRRRKKNANTETKEDNTQKIELEIFKQRDAARSPNIHIELHTVPAPDGLNVPHSLGKVPVWIEADETAQADNATSSKERKAPREAPDRKASPRKQREESRRQKISDFLKTRFKSGNNAPILRQDIEAHFKDTSPEISRTTLHRDLDALAAASDSTITIATTNAKVTVTHKKIEAKTKDLNEIPF